MNRKLLFAAVAAALVAPFSALAKAQSCPAEFGPQDAITARASADLSTHQYLAMRMTGTGPLCDIASNNLSASGPGLVAGVLQNNPSSGQAATIAYQGMSKARSGGAVTINALVTHDTSGFIIDAVSGSNVIGRALEACSNAREVITVQLQPPVRWGSVA